MKSWALYSVRFPAGDNAEYGFVTLNAYNSLQDMESQPTNADDFKKIHPDKTPEDYMRMIRDTRKNVRSDLWRLVDQAN